MRGLNVLPYNRLLNKWWLTRRVPKREGAQHHLLVLKIPRNGAGGPVGWGSSLCPALMPGAVGVCLKEGEDGADGWAGIPPFLAFLRGNHAVPGQKSFPWRCFLPSEAFNLLGEAGARGSVPL